MAHPTKTETVNLKHPQKLEIQGFQTMRSHLYLRYADGSVTINLQLRPEQAREVAEKLTAVADFCDDHSIAA